MGQLAYTPDQKMQAVEHYIATGNLKLVSALTEIPYITIRQWKAKPWWRDYEKELDAGRRFKVNKKLSKIIDRGLEVMDDRLENGDFVFDQVKGEIVRRPVTLKDANSAVTNLMQRQGVLEQQNNEEYNQDTTKTIQEQLVLLAAEFAKFNGRSKVDAEVIEFKENNALHEKRPQDWEIGEGLSEGSGPVHLETSSGEEEGGTEQSPFYNGESGEGS